MSIKSDRWIRQMARDHAMIEPFTDGQVREVDAKGRRVISYGVSSYGYDMRVAPEFKIFTNALSVIVDPKEFDAKSFVEFEGEVCVVPPNSFARPVLGFWARAKSMIFTSPALEIKKLSGLMSRCIHFFSAR